MKALIIEDSAIEMDVLKCLCAEFGIDADYVYNYQDAIDIYNPKLHVMVLTDVMLGSHSGIGVAEHVLELNPKAFIVFKTSMSPDNAFNMARLWNLGLVVHKDTAAPHVMILKMFSLAMRLHNANT